MSEKINDVLEDINRRTTSYYVLRHITYENILTQLVDKVIFNLMYLNMGQLPRRAPTHFGKS